MTTPVAPRTATRPWARISENRDVQRLLISLGCGVVVAIITGKSGSTAAPTRGITETFKSGTAYVWILIFVVLWLLLTLRERYRAQVAVVSRSVAHRRDQVTGNRPAKYGIYVGALVLAILL